MTPPGDRLSVEADLLFSVDGVDATLTGHGDRLVLESSSPEAVWDAITTAALPQGVDSVSGVRAVGRAAELLRQSGVQIDVRGPGGSLARVGADVHSTVGRVVTGSSAVAPGSVRALAPLVVHRVQQDRRLVAAAGAALSLALLVVGLVRRRRPAPRPRT